jgi:TM2 domain-containing membrane protein YozV
MSVPSYPPASSVDPTQRVGASGDARAMMLFDANKKSILLAYVLWFFLGVFGGHRFYSERIGSAIAQLVLAIFGFMTLWVFGLGLLLLIPLWIWVLIDAFLIPGWVQAYNNRLAMQIGAPPAA